jgi:tetratricopeptide (TPR) repeat protein
MSPEQARGEKLDPRTDIFSLGVVLYEMTTGQRPFSGTTNAEVLREILKARPRPPHEISARVPLDLERIIAKALAPARTDRYQTMDDLAVDLKRLNRELESGSSPSFDDISDPSKLRGWRRAWMWAVVGVLVAGPVAYGAWRLHVGSRTGADSRTILILPLHVAGQTEESAYPERAFAEAIAVNLAQSKNLTVLPVAGDSDLGRAGPLQRAAAAARLGAGRLLTASLTRQGGSIHASLNLVDTGRNRILWGAQQEGDNGSLSRLAASVSAALASELGAVPRRRYEYPLNMTGSPAMASSPDTAEAVGALRRYQNERALDLTERLVKEFPREPDALALRAYALFHASTASGVSFVYSQAGRNLLEQSLAALEHVDPGNAVGATIRCELLGGEVGRSEDRVTCANQLLSRDDLTPAARAWALRNRSVAKDSVGDTGAALEDIKEASLLDPTNHFSIEGIGLYREKMDDLPGAANAYRQCNALAPEFSQCYWLLYRVLQRVGKWQEAEAPAAKGCELERTRGFCAPYAYSLVKNGHRPEALEAAADAATLPSDDGGAFELARTQAVLGDRREALRFLRLAVKPGSTDLDMIKEAPYLFKEADFGSFQNDPEFRAVFADIRKFLSSSGSAGDRP